MPKGFGEERQQGFEAAGPLEPSKQDKKSPVRTKLKVGPGGRVVIPAHMREALGITEGDVVIATLEGGGLWLTSMGSALAYARSLVREAVPSGVRWDDELIAERRREVERESRE